MGIVMGADTAMNAQPAASPGRCVQCLDTAEFKGVFYFTATLNEKIFHNK